MNGGSPSVMEYIFHQRCFPQFVYFHACIVLCGNMSVSCGMRVYDMVVPGFFIAPRRLSCFAAVISCPDPGIPQFGSREGDIFTYNSQVSFTCNVGYRLINSQQRICQATGDWSGIQPVCNRK